VGAKIVDYTLVNNGSIAPDVRDFYARYKSIPVECDMEQVRKLGVTPLFYDLVEVNEGKIRHSPDKVRQALSDILSKAKYVKKGIFPL
jgi:hypothetical protein